MIKVLMACVVMLVLAICLVDVHAVSNTTSANATTAAKGGGFMVLPSILSLVLPAGLLASLLRNL